VTDATRQPVHRRIEHGAAARARPQILVHHDPQPEFDGNLVREDAHEPRVAAGHRHLAYADAHAGADGGELREVVAEGSSRAALWPEAVCSRNSGTVQIAEENQAIGEAALDDVIAGCYVFTGERSANSYHLNKMANTLRSAEARARFQADETGYMRGLGCSDHEIGMVRRRDWKAMMEHGASIYLLLKIGAAVGQSLPEIGAHTGGMTLAEFQARKEH
jgi:protocatechuate 4,5-dioxygenase alpha subunit